jgi:hypothetical protein
MIQQKLCNVTITIIRSVMKSCPAATSTLSIHINSDIAKILLDMMDSASKSSIPQISFLVHDYNSLVFKL